MQNAFRRLPYRPIWLEGFFRVPVSTHPDDIFPVTRDGPTSRPDSRRSRRSREPDLNEPYVSRRQRPSSRGSTRRYATASSATRNRQTRSLGGVLDTLRQRYTKEYVKSQSDYDLSPTCRALLQRFVDLLGGVETEDRETIYGLSDDVVGVYFSYACICLNSSVFEAVANGSALRSFELIREAQRVLKDLAPTQDGVILRNFLSLNLANLFFRKKKYGAVGGIMKRIRVRIQKGRSVHRFSPYILFKKATSLLCCDNLKGAKSAYWRVIETLDDIAEMEGEEEEEEESQREKIELHLVALVREEGFLMHRTGGTLTSTLNSYVKAAAHYNLGLTFWYLGQATVAQRQLSESIQTLLDLAPESEYEPDDASDSLSSSSSKNRRSRSQRLTYRVRLLRKVRRTSEWIVNRQEELEAWREEKRKRKERLYQNSQRGSPKSRFALPDAHSNTSPSLVQRQAGSTSGGAVRRGRRRLSPLLFQTSRRRRRRGGRASSTSSGTNWRDMKVTSQTTRPSARSRRRRRTTPTDSDSNSSPYARTRASLAVPTSVGSATIPDRRKSVSTTNRRRPTTASSTRTAMRMGRTAPAPANASPSRRGNRRRGGRASRAKRPTTASGVRRLSGGPKLEPIVSSSSTTTAVESSPKPSRRTRGRGRRRGGSRRTGGSRNVRDDRVRVVRSRREEESRVNENVGRVTGRQVSTDRRTKPSKKDRMKALVKIQSIARGWLARRRVEKLKQFVRAKIEAELLAERRLYGKTSTFAESLPALILRKKKAMDKNRGLVVAIVGEVGVGKSAVTRAITRAQPGYFGLVAHPEEGLTAESLAEVTNGQHRRCIYECRSEEDLANLSDVAEGRVFVVRIVPPSIEEYGARLAEHVESGTYSQDVVDAGSERLAGVSLVTRFLSNGCRLVNRSINQCASDFLEAYSLRIDPDMPSPNLAFHNAPKPILAVAGPPGSGKSTIIQRLLHNHPGCFGIPRWHTTSPTASRQPWCVCVSEEKFDDIRETGDFVEWEKGSDGAWYGLSFEAIEEVLNADLRPVVELHDFDSLQRLEERFETVSVFVKPSSMSRLQELWDTAGLGQDDDDDERYTLVSAEDWMAEMDEYQFCITNIRVDVSASHLGGFYRHLDPTLDPMKRSMDLRSNAHAVSEDRRPILVVSGPPGSGKSTVIRRLISYYPESFGVPKWVNNGNGVSPAEQILETSSEADGKDYVLTHDSIEQVLATFRRPVIELSNVETIRKLRKRYDVLSVFVKTSSIQDLTSRWGSIDDRNYTTGVAEDFLSMQSHFDLSIVNPNGSPEVAAQKLGTYYAKLDSSLPARKAPFRETPKPVLVLSGPAGCGKSLLVRKLLQDQPGMFGVPKWHTTSDSSLSCLSISETEFARMESSNEFVEVSTEADGCRYGLSFEEIRTVLDSDLRPVVELRDLASLHRLEDSSFDVLSVFIWMSLRRLEENWAESGLADALRYTSAKARATLSEEASYSRKINQENKGIVAAARELADVYRHVDANLSKPVIKFHESPKPVLVLSGPGGSGKSAVASLLVHNHPGEFALPKILTTSESAAKKWPSRYSFIERDEFMELRDGDFLIEYGRESDGELYGLAFSAIEDVLSADMRPIVELSGENATATIDRIRDSFEVLSVFLKMSSVKRLEEIWEESGLRVDVNGSRYSTASARAAMGVGVEGEAGFDELVTNHSLASTARELEVLYRSIDPSLSVARNQ